MKTSCAPLVVIPAEAGIQGHLVVVPAKAGIQKTLDIKPIAKPSIYRTHFATTALRAPQFLDSGLRRNDGEIDLTLQQECP